LYIKIDEERPPKPGFLSSSHDSFERFFEKLGNSENFEKMKKERRSLDLAWEYWNGADWTALVINDYTDFFHKSGFVEFDRPSGMASKEEFSKNLYWLRVRFVSGSFEAPPRVLAILTNAVYAQNKISYKDEIAGSGTGAPLQSVRPAHSPLLPGMALYVDEGSIPPGNELARMREEGIAEPYFLENGAGRVWVRYREVDNFYASTPASRHFVVDYREQRILFGDGARGINPPQRNFNIKLASYSAGGGAAGNAAAHTVRTLTRSIPFIAECGNPFPAEGGAGMEDLDTLKSRAAGLFKSLHRAVTAEDFQWLSREASASVGRVWCLREKNRQGEIVIIIIPALSRSHRSGTADFYNISQMSQTFQLPRLSQKLIPSRELLRRVTAHLDERKLVGTKIRVQAPVYRAFAILLTLLFKSDVLDGERLKKDIETALRTLFHPLLGGSGSGWEFGRSVTAGAVLRRLEKIDGIFSVDEARLYDADAGIDVDTLVLKADEIPYLDGVQINTRRAPE
jgi:predicted phage baseplate assembly protein